MAENEHIEERLQNMALEIEKLRWRGLMLETAFMGLWHFSFGASPVAPVQESTAAFLEIIEAIGTKIESGLRSSDDPED